MTKETKFFASEEVETLPIESEVYPDGTQNSITLSRM